MSARGGRAKKRVEKKQKNSNCELPGTGYEYYNTLLYTVNSVIYRLRVLVLLIATMLFCIKIIFI